MFAFKNLVFRLLLALLSGFVLGYGRSRKGRAAGLRTYTLTSLGACMAVLLAEYEYSMLTTTWATNSPLW